MANIRKRHHYDPIHYLQRFADTDGLLWQYELGRSEPVRVPPNHAGVERFLYAPEIGDQPYDDSIEVFLSEYVDGPSSSLISLIIEGKSFSEQQRYQFAVYLAIQEFRVPRMRDSVLKMIGKMGEQILKVCVAHPEVWREQMRSEGLELSDDEFGEIVEDIRAGVVKPEPTKIGWLLSFQAALQLARTIMSLPWLVAEAPSGFEFITSDAPVVKVLTDRKVPRMFAGGWLSPPAETTFALAPSHALVIRPDGREGRIQALRMWCEDVNSRTIGQANRFIFCRSRDAALGRMIEEEARRRSRIRDG